ncbi:hypothetical protein GGR51DRAFT_571307 [Nemania sp. FL0031]|nr:hypothetical protein GGR51DRAFT_571307 [Nemania sp. FL0031]
MDPISALSLAANIYAFVDAGFKVVYQFNDFRRNALNESRDNTERRIIAENLRDISSQLATEGPPFLVELGKNCSRLSQELLELLDKLTVKNPNSARERVGVIFRGWLRSPDIASLENRLETYRTQLIVSFLPILRDEQSKFNEKLDNLQDELRQLKDSRSDELTKLRSDLLEAMRPPENQSVRTSSDRVGSLLLELRDMVKVSSPEVAILKQLRFSNIYDREDAIKEATKGTFTWAMQESSSNKILGTTFNGLGESLTPWLQSGSGVFHISGKAGSGKSTLMKHIWLHDRTQEHLKMWAGDKKLLRAAFFFWAAGNAEQKSLTGLFRSILFSVLSQDRNLIPQIFPECWNNGQFASHSIDHLTRPSVVKAAFQALLSKGTDSEYRICLFIDGLDEYEAPDRESYWELAEQLGNWADGSRGSVKLCVSSRPYAEFENAFGPCDHLSRQQIHLHELNKRDIEEHCQNTLSEAKRLHGITNPKRSELFSRQIEKSSEYLVREIGHRAEGVFLWAVLVVRIIISEAKRGGSDGDLEKKLEEIPEDIDRLYAKMLGSLNPSEKKLSNRLFFAVLTNPFELDMNALCLKWLTSKDRWKSRFAWKNDYAREDVIEDINYITQHLDIWTHGLIEAHHLSSYNSRYTSTFRTRVKFCHRTARDYLLHSMQLSELQSAFEGFDLARLHADLRMTEMALLEYVYGSYTIADYKHGYEILTAESDITLGPIGSQIGEYQVTWPVVKELMHILPSRCLIRIFERWNRQTVLDSLRFGEGEEEEEQTSLHLIEASLGLNDNDITEGLESAGSSSSRGNLLLGACLSSLFLPSPPLVRKVPARDLVRSLLKKGFSAYERVKIVSSHDFLEKQADTFGTVWMILASSLWPLDMAVSNDTSFTPVYNRKEIITNAMRELLCHESQEEVLFLTMLKSRNAYDSFMTLEDLLGLDITKTDAIFDRLRDWPKYDVGGPVSEGAPSWIWENWRGRTRYPIAESLEKITVENIGSLENIAQAVVSRKDIFESLRGGRFELW